MDEMHVFCYQQNLPVAWLPLGEASTHIKAPQTCVLCSHTLSLHVNSAEFFVVEILLSFGTPKTYLFRDSRQDLLSSRDAKSSKSGLFSPRCCGHSREVIVECLQTPTECGY